MTDIISFGVAPAFIMYFWVLNTLGKVGWLISLVYVVCIALRLARFNINTGGEPSWRDNFFEGVPSPAGGILVLTPLIYEVSGLGIVNLNYQILVPSIFVVVSILLISKMPTYAFKKISVKRKTTVFLVFGVVLAFVLLFMFPFQTLVAATSIYILSLPISFFHYSKLDKKNKSENLFDHEEPEDFL